MMHDKAMRSLSALCLGLVCGGFAACAGDDTPPTSDELESQIAQAYAGGVAAAGTGGAGSGGSGGSGGSSAGSANNGGSNPGPSGGAGGNGGSAPAGGGTANEPDPPAEGCDGLEILQASCDGGGCHGAGSTLGNFAESLEAAELLVDAEPLTAGCADFGPVFDSENPQQSLVVQKVNGAAPCGSDMPLGPAPLDDDEIECLVEWIGNL